MTEHTGLEERFEVMAVRLERVEKVNRLMKVWGAVAIAMLIAAGPFASAVMAKPKPKVPAVIEAQRINLETSGGQVLASLGVDSDGTGLTIFDSSGKKTLTLGDSADGTFTGLATWDGNSIFPASTAVVRTAFGEANAKNANAGLGFAVYDSTGKARVGSGTTPDLTEGFFETIDPNGSTTGIVDDDRAGFVNQGFFANDLHGTTRSFVGNSLDGTTFNTAELFAATGKFAGSLFESTASGASVALIDPSGTFFAGENADGAGVDWDIFDSNGTNRLFGAFDGTTEAVDLFSPTAVLVAHLP